MLLLSGGIDSPVAGHLVRARGATLDAVHFSLEPVTDAAAGTKARRIAALLGLPHLHVVRVGEAFMELVRACTHRYYFVLSKRLMVRLAERLAREEGCDFLVTGENLGQVSSQTLANLRTIDAVAVLPVVRPLIGFDKQDIVALARRIGTYEISKGPEVCDVLGPSKPATKASVAAVREEEGRLDLPALVDSVLAEAQRERLNTAGDMERPARPPVGQGP
jgi:thiamine biosynthesis protein ThiI